MPGSVRTTSQGRMTWKAGKVSTWRDMGRMDTTGGKKPGPGAWRARGPRCFHFSAPGLRNRPYRPAAPITSGSPVSSRVLSPLSTGFHPRRTLL